MSYFDHVRCPHCRAMIDPEKVGGQSRQMMCPRCNGQLSVVDLFGVGDAFVEEDEPSLTLEDAVPNWGTDESGPSQHQAPPPPPRQEQAPNRGPRATTGKGGGDQPSALDLMRQMKKKR